MIPGERAVAGIGEILGTGSGRDVTTAGCRMVVAVGREETEAVVSLFFDLALRIPAGTAKLPGATSCSGTFSVDVSEVISSAWATLRILGGKKDSSLSSSLSLFDVLVISGWDDIVPRWKNGLPVGFVVRRCEERLGANNELNSLHIVGHLSQHRIIVLIV